jgi:hypothetical protein
MIRIPSILGWRVVVQHQFFTEVIKAPDDVLSFDDFIEDVSFQGPLYEKASRTDIVRLILAASNEIYLW